MSELIVIGFKQDMYRASHVLDELRALDYDWVIDLRDAVAVYRNRHGELRLDQSYGNTVGEGAGWGFLWGSLIGGLLAIPFTAGASAAGAAGALAVGALGGGTLGAIGGAADADWWQNEIGLSETFVRDVGSLVDRGDSAIFALLRSADPIYATERLAGYGGTILRTTLTSEQTAKLQKVLDNRGL
ncbi:DUF1269 domain-containing protein [Sphingobium yanoikuyae]|uniref:DUF1269 domain-containing protein n=1 Tax=Sphingobium yanoikuyae TaxID=13690 RepID=A0A6P1GMG0_SPHYA|nr:DUF1269 domain-containing protein [Sphingobium yanoikuyae]QHD69628.1 DUF1269 domain-containing protein [Sphingobium yanoikuyae]